MTRTSLIAALTGLIIVGLIIAALVTRSDQPMATPSQSVTSTERTESVSIKPISSAAPAPSTHADEIQDRTPPILEEPPTSKGEPLPEPIVELLHNVYQNQRLGNLEYAAMLAIEVADQSPERPALAAHMRYVAGHYYQQLDKKHRAIELYYLALLTDPEQRNAYQALRRVDPDFAANNPPYNQGTKKNGGQRPPSSKTSNNTNLQNQ